MDAQELDEFNNARIEKEKNGKDLISIAAHQKIESVRAAQIAALKTRIADATAKAESALSYCREAQDFWDKYGLEYVKRAELLLTSLLVILKGSE